MGQFRRQKVTDPTFLYIKTNQGRNAFSGSVLSLRNRCTAFMLIRPLLTLRAMESGTDLAGRSKRRSARRNAMFRPINYGLVRSISLSALLLSVSAMGQFEVAPDHFDSSTAKKTVRHTATKSRVKHRVSAGAQANGRPSAGAAQAGARIMQNSNGTKHTLAPAKPTHSITTAASRTPR